MLIYKAVENIQFTFINSILLVPICLYCLYVLTKKKTKKNTIAYNCSYHYETWMHMVKIQQVLHQKFYAVLENQGSIQKTTAWKMWRERIQISSMEDLEKRHQIFSTEDMKRTHANSNMEDMWTKTHPGTCLGVLPVLIKHLSRFAAAPVPCFLHEKLCCHHGT